MLDEVNLLIGGPQGAGLETSMQLLSYSLTSLGHGIVSDREYYSNIKGRHSYINLRTGSTGFPRALKEKVQIVGAMDAETIFTHFDELAEGGLLVYDSSTLSKSVDKIPSMLPSVRERVSERLSELNLEGTVESLVSYLESNAGYDVAELDFQDILSNLAGRFQLVPEQASRYVSSILYGAIAGLLDLDEGVVSRSMERRFAGREKIVEHNVYLANHVSNLVKEAHGSPYRLKPSGIPERELVVGSGNDVVAMGKLVGGLRYQSYYPITPAADESFYIESHETLTADEDLGGVVVLQTEDELAAVTSAIGAALTGARSATATSGPGFSLMVEGLGWAGMNEVPVVITYYQRSGPSTGQATRGSQADLLSALFSSHGEFSKFVLASGDFEEAFHDSIEAFNLAERYQVPVIHLLDKFLANSIATMPLPDLKKVRIERGEMLKNPGAGYKRFDLSKTISPRAVLGSDAVIGHSGAEHDEFGRTSEDPVNRVRMYEKRLRKLELADSELPLEGRAVVYGPEDSDFLLVGWGYAKMVALDALEELDKLGYRGSYLHLKMFSPFPSDYVRSTLNGYPLDRVMSIEHNYLAQASMVVKLHTGFDVGKRIVKYTGRPMYLNEVTEAVRKILDEGETKVVLRHGA